MENTLSDGNVKFIEGHGCTVKRLSPSTVIVLDTYYQLGTRESFDSLLTRKPDGSYQEITLKEGTLIPVSEPLQLENLRHFLNY